MLGSESWDLAFVLTTEAYDHGDAPDPSYPTLLASNGAGYTVTEGAIPPAAGNFNDGLEHVGSSGGNAAIAMYYAGDYLMMAAENPDLKFYLPKEGFNLFIDAICIPKGCQNKEAAEEYINFLCDPEISGGNLDYLGYSTPISDAKQYMDPSMAESEVAYPPADVLKGGSSFLNLSSETSQQMDSLWLQVKTQGGVDNYAIWCMCILAAVMAVYLAVREGRRKRRIANRCKKWKQAE